MKCGGGSLSAQTYHKPNSLVIIGKEVTKDLLAPEVKASNDLDTVVLACQYLRTIEIYQQWWDNLGGEFVAKKY